MNLRQKRYKSMGAKNEQVLFNKLLFMYFKLSVIWYDLSVTSYPLKAFQALVK